MGSKAAKGYVFYLSSWPCLPDFPFFVLGFLCVNDFCSKERRIFRSIPSHLADFPILVVGFVKASILLDDAFLQQRRFCAFLPVVVFIIVVSDYFFFGPLSTVPEIIVFSKK